MAHRSHEEMTAHLQRGRTVMIDGRLIADPGQLPNPEELTTGDAEAKRRIREGLERQRLALEHRLARLEESPRAEQRGPTPGSDVAAEAKAKADRELQEEEARQKEEARLLEQPSSGPGSAEAPARDEKGVGRVKR